MRKKKTDMTAGMRRLILVFVGRGRGETYLLICSYKKVRFPTFWLMGFVLDQH